MDQEDVEEAVVEADEDEVVEEDSRKGYLLMKWAKDHSYIYVDLDLSDEAKRRLADLRQSLLWVVLMVLTGVFMVMKRGNRNFTTVSACPSRLQF